MCEKLLFNHTSSVWLTHTSLAFYWAHKNSMSSFSKDLHLIHTMQYSYNLVITSTKEKFVVYKYRWFKVS